MPFWTLAALGMILRNATAAKVFRKWAKIKETTKF